MGILSAEQKAIIQNVLAQIEALPDATGCRSGAIEKLISIINETRYIAARAVDKTNELLIALGNLEPSVKNKCILDLYEIGERLGATGILSPTETDEFLRVENFKKNLFPLGLSQIILRAAQTETPQEVFKRKQSNDFSLFLCQEINLMLMSATDMMKLQKPQNIDFVEKIAQINKLFSKKTGEIGFQQSENSLTIGDEQRLFDAMITSICTLETVDDGAKLVFLNIIVKFFEIQGKDYLFNHDRLLEQQTRLSQKFIPQVNKNNVTELSDYVFCAYVIARLEQEMFHIISKPVLGATPEKNLERLERKMLIESTIKKIKGGDNIAVSVKQMGDQLPLQYKSTFLGLNKPSIIACTDELMQFSLQREVIDRNTIIPTKVITTSFKLD